MCGIAVSVGSDDRNFIDASLRTMTYRGPDDEGLFHRSGITFGHRRLSIIDVRGGRQPIVNEGGDKAIVLNGEIYNFRELRRSLEARYRFTTHTDTEVLLHLYEDLGPECLHRLSGMFAFAIFDNGRVFLARDRIGIKPLYYGTLGTETRFASELKCLSDCSTIQEFPPGHYYTTDEGFVRYYDLPASKEYTLSLEESFDRVRELVREAVERRLVADVPVGVFLSGGLDSSIIAAVMRRHHDQLHSFAVGMEGSPDLAAAREVSRALDTTHHEHVYTQEEMIRILPEVIYHLESFDAPLVRSSIPGFFVSRLANPFVKVILTGEGSDELFSGYHYLKSIKDSKALFTELVRITSQLYNTNLQRTDRMTMAHSLEARVPFLDPDVVEFAFSLPVHIRQASGDGIEKWFLRKAFEGMLPDSIVWRTKQKFSEGAGSSGVMESVAEEAISYKEFVDERQRAPVTIRSKEELYYYRLFRSHFPELPPDIVGRTRDYSSAAA
jgi:asparagine synthase (glutamine-hydrolysing)